MPKKKKADYNRDLILIHQEYTFPLDKLDPESIMQVQDITLWMQKETKWQQGDTVGTRSESGVCKMLAGIPGDVLGDIKNSTGDIKQTEKADVKWRNGKFTSGVPKECLNTFSPNVKVGDVVIMTEAINHLGGCKEGTIVLVTSTTQVHHINGKVIRGIGCETGTNEQFNKNKFRMIDPMFENPEKAKLVNTSPKFIKTKPKGMKVSKKGSKKNRIKFYPTLGELQEIDTDAKTIKQKAKKDLGLNIKLPKQGYISMAEQSYEMVEEGGTA